METEIWIPIEETFGRYLINNVGNVKNAKTGRILRPASTSGYLCVSLQVEIGLKRTFYVHRLVARYFCEGYQENLVVNHIDGDKLNNHYTNLEWVTYKENTKHAFDTGLSKYSGCVKKQPVICIETGIQYESLSEASLLTGTKHSNISAVCRGKRKSTGGYTWRYVADMGVVE